MIPLVVLLTSTLTPSFLLHPSQPPHFYRLMPWWWGSWWPSKIMRVYLSFLPILYPLKSHLLQKLTVRGSFLLEKKCIGRDAEQLHLWQNIMYSCSEWNLSETSSNPLALRFKPTFCMWNKPRRVHNICLIQICEPVILCFCESDVLPLQTISDYIQPAADYVTQIRYVTSQIIIRVTSRHQREESRYVPQWSTKPLPKPVLSKKNVFSVVSLLMWKCHPVMIKKLRLQHMHVSLAAAGFAVVFWLCQN